MVNFELPRILTPPLAAKVGVSRARVRTELRRGNWQRLAAGVVLTSREEPTRSDWGDVGLALAGPAAALSGWDAVRTYGLGDPEPPSSTVLVLDRGSGTRVIGSVRIRATNRPYRSWTTPYDARPYPLTPVVHAARAVADTALAYQRLAEVRALVTSAVQRRKCTLPELVAEYEAGPRQGSRLLRIAFADALAGARSEAEAVAARRLRRSKVPPFQLNVAVRDRLGRMVLDVYWEHLRAALEVDSREYHFSENEWKASMARHNRLTALGISVTHYPPSRVMGRDTSWVTEVERWLSGRAHELRVPFA